MIARKQIDIGWGDIAYAMAAGCGLTRELAAPAGALLACRADSLVCLAVRSGFDLLLAELAWPAGSEVLVSAITIPDMTRILREHGLVPVPVDIDPETLAVDEAALDAARTPRTKAVLVAHLFGSHLVLGRIADWAHAHGLLMLEDCAQAFTADGFVGHEASNVRMFSFGPIKTATALGGAVLLVQDAALLDRLRRRHATWPVQSTGAFLRRVLKFACFHPLLLSWTYGAIMAAVRLAGRDPDVVITQLGRGFAGGDFFQKLRHRPCEALVRLLEHRLATYDANRVRRRAAAGERVLMRLATVRPLGAQAPNRTHWLFPLRVRDRAALMRRLAREGFDTTCASSSLYAVPGDNGHPAPPAATAAMSHVLYVPVYAEMGPARLDRLADLLNELAQPPESS